VVKWQLEVGHIPQSFLSPCFATAAYYRRGCKQRRKVVARERRGRERQWSAVYSNGKEDSVIPHHPTRMLRYTSEIKKKSPHEANVRLATLFSAVSLKQHTSLTHISTACAMLDPPPLTVLLPAQKLRSPFQAAH
jgi:hypothetical protein